MMRIAALVLVNLVRWQQCLNSEAGEKGQFLVVSVCTLLLGVDKYSIRILLRSTGADSAPLLSLHIGLDGHSSAHDIIAISDYFHTKLFTLEPSIVTFCTANETQ